MSKRKQPKNSPRKVSNKERDQAIGHLYNGMDQALKEIRSASSLIALYIEFRKDDKRFRGWLERKHKADNAKVEKMESVKGKLDIHEEEMRRENG
jgi:hypothetical protein